MNPSPFAKAWYLLLAANENMRARFFALPCETLDDLATQLALHARTASARAAAPRRAS